MRVLVAAVLVALAGIPAANGADAEIHVVQQGMDTTPPAPDLLAKVIALVESSTVESSQFTHPAKRWDEAVDKPMFVHALFESPREMRLMRSDSHTFETTPVSEVRIVLSERGWTDHILVKVGSQIRSVTKYSPCRMADLVVASNLRVSTEQHTELLKGYCAEYKNAWQ